MKRISLATTFLFLFVVICFPQNSLTTKTHLSPTDRNLLQNLLNFPSPPKNRSAEIIRWLKRENEELSGKTNIIPTDDAPIEELVKFWAGKRIYDVPKPSETTKERLLEAAKKNSSLISPLLPFLPTHKSSTEIVKAAYTEENSKISSESVIGEWLMLNSGYKREELIAAVQNIPDKLDEDDVNYDNYLTALANLDWETAYPFINSFWANKNPMLSTFAVTLLYKHAAKENSINAENFREQLKLIAIDKNAKQYSRNAAIESLMKTEWNGRDEWFISLFSDESLDSNSFTDVVAENPDYWIPKIVGLLGDSNKTVHLAAVSCLAQFEKYGVREDAIKALLPYLTDTDDWKYTDAGSAIYSLNFINLPESIPILKKIVQKEEGFIRSYAAEILGVKYKIASVAPILEEALMQEMSPAYQEGIIQGLVHCGGLSNEKKIKAIEFYLQNPPKDEYFTGEDRLPLISLGIYLSKFESTNEIFTRTLLDYAEQLEPDKPEIAAKIKSLVFSWNNAEANRALIKTIGENKANAEDILAAVQNHEEIKKNFSAEIKSLLENGGKKAGIAAVIFGDAERISKIIDGNDQEAQVFLFASARVSEKFIGGSFLISGTGIEVQVKLPLENVPALFAKKDKLLSTAIEKYLESDDSEIARRLILSQYKGKAKIVGRRLPQQFGSGFEVLDKWEESFRQEILKDKDLDEIFTISVFANVSTVIRIRKGKAEVTESFTDWETKKSTVKKYFLSEEKLIALRNGFAKTNPFALKPISIPSNSCYNQPTTAEFLYLTKNGGVRVYVASPIFGGIGGEGYSDLFSFWGIFEED